VIAAIRNNLGLKVLSIAVALAIWGVITASDPIEQRIMQFALQVDAGKKAVVSLIPANRTIEAYVQGHSSQLTRLQQLNPPAILDGGDLPAGVAQKVKPHLERLPRGLKVDFSPGSFELMVDEKQTAEFVPVEETDGQLPGGYFINSRTGLPPSVWVDGAKPLVAKVARVIYRLNLSSITGSTALSVEFIAVDSNNAEIHNLVITPAKVDLGINLQSSSTMKSVPVVVDYQGNPSPNHAVTSLSSEPFTIDVAGSASALEKVKNVHTVPIDLTGKTDSFEETVALVSPSGDVNLSGKTVKVNVQIQLVTTVMEFENVQVQLRGQADNLDYAISLNAVNVSVEGSADKTSVITPDLIRPTVDVTGLQAGVHKLKITVDLPAGVTLDKVTPEEVEVTITVKPTPKPPAPDPPGGNNGKPG
jgi:YbbR domain-containing protein